MYARYTALQAYAYANETAAADYRLSMQLFGCRVKAHRLASDTFRHTIRQLLS